MADRRNKAPYSEESPGWADAVEASSASGSAYVEAIGRIERLHRRLIGIVRGELIAAGYSDLTPVQALLLFNIGEDRLSPGSLHAEGRYLGSNVSYNLAKLARHGYLTHSPSPDDRRMSLVKLTAEGHKVRGLLDALYARHQEELGAGEEPLQFEALNDLLARIERFWTEKSTPPETAD